MSEDFTVLRDLQSHLRTAQVPFEQLSTLAQQGDDMLVEKFLTENIKIHGSGFEVLQSQLYISCFWGLRDVVQQLLSRGVDANFQNKGTLWTPLHAATFQEHGPVVMVLLENGASPEKPDSEGRTPKDFASASDKIWPHFAALGFERTPRKELIEKSVIKKVQDIQGSHRKRSIRMASDSRPESAYAYNSDPFIHAAVTGDVLADQDEEKRNSAETPQFSMWR
ncbi:ankyrin repeat domain-containing protein 54-like isoform X2 [Ostrea edulis]|uniref:ankyrin repeat domain-containing protein 54-like isoform X2 n=1 Tax=Ostrea edulis TaxID=37623 RepID=UPI0024AEAAD6|nr:ankyrin repeat domain-containing protein 54-like isoform X2 [Ostrea edulis]